MKGTYNFTETVLKTVWTITHNLDSDAVVVDVYIDNGPNGPLFEKILPQNVKATDDNTVVVTFSSNRTGVARVAA